MNSLKKKKSLKFKEQKELEIQKDQRELEIQKEIEYKRLEIKAEMRKAELQAEIERSRASSSTLSFHSSGFVPSRKIRMVPPFNELEVDKYFQHFEKVAENLKWPAEHWSIMLQSVLKGKAQLAFSSLPVTDTTD